MSLPRLKSPLHSVLPPLLKACVLALLAVGALPALGTGVNVLTQHNDNMRSGQNLSETTLTLANVNSGQFGKLFDQTVDGYVYAQPLVMAGVDITAGSNKGTHNVVFVATEHDSVFAFDADSNTGANASPLWQASFIDPANGIIPVPSDPNGGQNDVGTNDIVPEIGITATPVIDPVTDTLYVLSKTKKIDPANPSTTASWSWHQHLHALDIHTGKEKAGSPVEIVATVFGTGDGNNGDGTLSFNPLTQHCRPGLLLLNGVVYLGWASHGDNGPYHGWIIGYNKTTLQQAGVYNATPDGGLGGVWMSGSGLPADSKGNIYFSTGNGTFDVDNNGFHYGNNYGDSVLKLATGANGSLTQTDYFTPYNQNDLNNNDTDLGSGGVLLLPDQPGAHPHLAITCGKQGNVYVIDRDHMGGFNPSLDPVVQVLPGGVGGTWSMPAYFNGKVYYHGTGDVLKAFDLISGKLSDEPTAQGPNTLGFPAPTPCITANRAQNAILWEVGYGSPPVLYAYPAASVATELYDSNQAASNRDNPAGAGGVKFAVPTIANGKVFLGSQGTLTVFGLFHNQDTLTVSINGSGSVPAAFLGATPRIVNNLYTITATPDAKNVFAGWKDLGSGNIISYSPTLTFTMKVAYTLEADFVANPFTAVAGSYAGYTLVQTQSYMSAGIASFTVSATGSFTGAVKLAGTTYNLTGVFHPDGTYSTSIPRSGKTPVIVQLQLDVSNGTNQITGSIYDGLFTGAITSNRPAPPPASKHYTLILPHPADTTQPQGDGYGTLVVAPNGNLTFAGVLGDGSAVTQSTVVSGNNQWLFYVAPYGGNGSATGVITFEDNGTSDLDGVLRWYKPLAATPQILTSIASYGSAYDSTAVPVLNLNGSSAFTFTIAGGGLNPVPATKSFTLTNANRLALQSGSTGLTMGFTTATGLMTGTFLDTAKTSHTYGGVVFQRGFSANGLFLSGGKAGSVRVSN